MTSSLNIVNLHEDCVITKAIQVLNAGGIVIFPSDTVYGLLVDATNEKAVDTLISFKNRAPGKAISVFVSDFDMINDVVTVDKNHSSLIHELLPGPFTVVLESKHMVSRKLESEKGTLGVRYISYKPIQELVQAYGRPITATSANLGGKPPHYSVESLLKQIPKQKKDLISLIVDGGKLPRNKPSTVIDLTQQTIKILRQGDIVLSELNRFHSKSTAQTAKIGAYIAESIIKPLQGAPVVCVLEGDLGAGKTALVKGLASYFNIQNIVSPTFVVYYEYEIADSEYKTFIHADLYNIQHEEEFQHLGLEGYLRQGSLMCVEWGEKLGGLYKEFQKKAKVLYITITYTSDTEREIIIKS